MHVSKTFNMNEVQKKAVHLAESGHSFVLLGLPGTGKTFTVKAIAQLLRQNGCNISVTATTGAACQQYEDAVTIHSWAGLDDGRHANGALVQLLKEDQRKSGAKSRITTTNCLIIDEISMLSAKMLTQLEFVCRQLRDKSLSWGGLQVILVGDPLQLRPCSNPRYGDAGEPPYKSPAWDLGHKVILEEIRRARDPQLVQVIHDLAKGKVAAESVRCLQERTSIIGKGLRLFSRKIQVEKYNSEQLLENGGCQKIYTSIDKASDNQALNNLAAPKFLRLRIGAPVILLQNISSKLVNGRRGVLEQLLDDCVIVNFEDVGSTKIERTTFTVFDPKLQRDVAWRLQLPLNLAYALTIHKAQGMTLEQVTIDCKLMEFPGLLTVAVGRVTTLTGLHLLNFDTSNILKADAADLAQYTEMVLHCSDNFSCCKRKDIGVINLDDKLANEAIEIEDMMSQLDISKLVDDLDQAIKEPPSSQSLNIFETNDFPLQETPSNFSAIDQLTSSKFTNVQNDSHNLHNDSIDKMIKSSNLQVVTQTVFSHLYQVHRKVVKKIPCGSGTYNDKVIELIHSSSFEHARKLLFDSSYTETDNFNLWNLFMEIGSFVESQRITENVDVGQSEEVNHQRSNISRLENASERGKVRYIGGYVVGSIKSKHMNMMRNSSSLDNYEKIRIWENHEKTVHLMSKLTRHVTSLLNETADLASLNETIMKQFPGGHLTHITDHAYSFFENVLVKYVQLMNLKSLARYGAKTPEKIIRIMLQDPEIKDSFLNLFSTNNAQNAENSFIFHVLSELIIKFANVMTRQWVTDLTQRNENNRKKRAHRVEVLLPNKRAKLDD